MDSESRTALQQVSFLVGRTLSVRNTELKMLEHLRPGLLEDVVSASLLRGHTIITAL